MTRLKRRTSRLGQIGGGLAISLLLGALSYFLIRYAENWVMYLVGGGFGLVAIAVFFLGVVQQTFALRTPETVIEMDA
ncbi:MAG TPA: hypothetical protein VM733_21995, partial [Thermoanaerobaculia bacterium]|nr:hypothetical protein [Thermoanaerobaculia bacterium]